MNHGFSVAGAVPASGVFNVEHWTGLQGAGEKSLIGPTMQAAHSPKEFGMLPAEEVNLLFEFSVEEHPKR